MKHWKSILLLSLCAILALLSGCKNSPSDRFAYSNLRWSIPLSNVLNAYDQEFEHHQVTRIVISCGLPEDNAKQNVVLTYLTVYGQWTDIDFPDESCRQKGVISQVFRYSGQLRVATAYDFNEEIMRKYMDIVFKHMNDRRETL